MDVAREKGKRGLRRSRQTERLHRSKPKGSTSERQNSDAVTPPVSVAASPYRRLIQTQARCSAFDRLGDISSYAMSVPKSLTEHTGSSLEPAFPIPLLHTRSEVDAVHQLLLLQRSDPLHPVKTIRPSSQSAVTDESVAALAACQPDMIPGSVRASSYLSPVVHMQRGPCQPENRMATVQVDGTTTDSESLSQRKRDNDLTLEEQGKRRRLLPLQQDSFSSETEVFVPCKSIPITMTPAPGMRQEELHDKRIRELRPSTDIVMDTSGDWRRCPAATLFRQVLQQHSNCTLSIVVNQFYAVGGRLLRVEQDYYLPVSLRRARLAVSILRQDILAKEMAATESKTSRVINKTLKNESSTMMMEHPFVQRSDCMWQEANKRAFGAINCASEYLSERPNAPKLVQAAARSKIISQDTKFGTNGGILVLPVRKEETDVFDKSPSDVVTTQIVYGCARVNDAAEEVSVKDILLPTCIEADSRYCDRQTKVAEAAKGDHRPCSTMANTIADTVIAGIPNKDTFNPLDEPIKNGDVKVSDRHFIVLGRSGVHTRLGNKIFRTMCNEFRDTYTTTPHCLKQVVVERLIRQIDELDPPGKFVELDESSGAYVEISAFRVKSKVAQALREKRPLSRKKVVPTEGNVSIGRAPDDMK